MCDGSVYVTGMYQQAVFFSSLLKFDLQAAVSSYTLLFSYCSYCERYILYSYLREVP